MPTPTPSPDAAGWLSRNFDTLSVAIVGGLVLVVLTFILFKLPGHGIHALRKKRRDRETAETAAISAHQLAEQKRKAALNRTYDSARRAWQCIAWLASMYDDPETSRPTPTAFTDMLKVLVARLDEDFRAVREDLAPLELSTVRLIELQKDWVTAHGVGYTKFDHSKWGPIARGLKAEMDKFCEVVQSEFPQAGTWEPNQCGDVMKELD